MTDLTLLITVVLLVSALVFIPIMLISGRWSEGDWKSKYVREWFKQHPEALKQDRYSNEEWESFRTWRDQS